MIWTSVMKKLNVSQFMSGLRIFDTIRHINIKYINIKISQVHWFSRQYLEFTIIFSLFYLFDWKLVDLMIFSFFPWQNWRRGFPPPDGVGRALSRPEVTGPQTRKFIKQSNCFSVKFAKLLREHILKNI